MNADPFDDDDPFAEIGPERDRWGRPKIIQTKRNGEPDPKKLVPYTRASTFAGALSEAGGLIKWQLWCLALGLGRSESLAGMAGVFGPTVDDLSRVDKQALDDIIERAHMVGGGTNAADHGTAVHALTEPGNEGVTPERMQADVDSYWAALDAHGIETVDAEQFVVCDSLKVAGTYDHRYRFTCDVTLGDGTVVPAGTVVIGDKKTGKSPHFPEHVIQLATYAHSEGYDYRTGERTALDVSPKWGIVAHIPKGQARTDLYLVDLAAGWEAAKLAEKVRAHRTRKDLAKPFPTTPLPAEPVAATASAEVVEPVVVEVAPVVTPEVNEPAPATPAAAEVVEPVAEAPDTAEADAVALLENTLGAVTVEQRILDLIAATSTAGECAAIWREYAKPPAPAWTDVHTEAVRAKYPADVKPAAA